MQIIVHNDAHAWLLLSFNHYCLYLFFLRCKHIDIYTQSSWVIWNNCNYWYTKEQDRGDELEEQITNERRLLEETEDKKLTIIRKMLQQQLEELKEQNMMKEWQLIEIEKRKVCTLEDAYELEEKFAVSVSFLLLHCVFWYLQVFYL